MRILQAPLLEKFLWVIPFHHVSWYKRSELCTIEEVYLLAQPFSNTIEEEEHFLLITYPRYDEHHTHLKEDTKSLVKSGTWNSVSCIPGSRARRARRDQFPTRLREPATRPSPLFDNKFYSSMFYSSMLANLFICNIYIFVCSMASILIISVRYLRLRLVRGFLILKKGAHARNRNGLIVGLVMDLGYYIEFEYLTLRLM